MNSPLSMVPDEPEERAAWRAPLLSSDSVLHRIADDLAAAYAGVFSPETVERYVCESYQLLSGQARITTHVVGMTGRFAGERLRALGQARGLLDKPVPEVLFVCVHNAGRSQMAASLLRWRGAGRLQVLIGDVLPADRVGG